MTDRELLEMAAKAAGLVVIESRGGGLPFTVANGTSRDHTRYPWNPLTDDGDAHRLAVKLNLLDEHAGFTYALAEECGRIDDRGVATRRAIVRAAAATLQKQGAA